VEFKLAAVNQASKPGQFGKFRADHHGPVMAASVSTRRRQEADFVRVSLAGQGQLTVTLG
jgi:hypothetical protein